MELFSFVQVNSVFLFRFVIHAATLILLVRFLYYPDYRDRDFAFSYLMFSSVVFLVTYFLKSVDISLGFTFGLFAVFAILRYRTETITTKEMTYLFIVIGTAMLNAVSNLGYGELILINALVLVFTFVAQHQNVFKREKRKNVEYERIDLIHPSRFHELKADLEARLGVRINHIEVRDVDFVRDHASLRVFYTDGLEKHSRPLEANHEKLQKEPV